MLFHTYDVAKIGKMIFCHDILDQLGRGWDRSGVESSGRLEMEGSLVFAESISKGMHVGIGGIVKVLQHT